MSVSVALPLKKPKTTTPNSTLKTTSLFTAAVEKKPNTQEDLVSITMVYTALENKLGTRR